MENRHLQPAAGYARRSTDMQERSIPDQKAYIEKWAGENGYRIVRWYIDDAISGTSTKGREGFENLIRDAENASDFKTVICYDISRFSRGGTNETGYYLHRLQTAGVQTIFAADGIPEGDEGELIQGVKSWQARQYSVKLSRDTMRGMLASVTQSKNAPGSGYHYGYDRQFQTVDGRVLRTIRKMPDGRRMEMDSQGNIVRHFNPGEKIRKGPTDIAKLVPSAPERVVIVQRVYDEYLAGDGPKIIANRLNEEKVPPLFSNRWTLGAITSILTSPIYCGAIVWNKTSQGKMHSVDGKGTILRRQSLGKTTNGRDEWIVIPDVHESLVSKEIFEQTQIIRQKNRCYRGRAAGVKNRSMLSGLFRCMHCGNGFHHTNIYSRYKGNRKRYRLYRCTSHTTSGNSVCPAASIRADKLEAWVLAQIKMVLLGGHKTTSAAVDEFVSKAIAQQSQPTDISAIKKKLTMVNNRIQATLGMLTDLAFEGMDEIKNTLSELKLRRDELQLQLQQASESNPKLPDEQYLRQWATERIEQLDGVDLTNHPSSELRQLVHSIVDRIEVNPIDKTGALFLPANLYDTFDKFIVCNSNNGNPYRWACFLSSVWLYSDANNQCERKAKAGWDRFYN